MTVSCIINFKSSVYEVMYGVWYVTMKMVI